ncbi:MAG: histidinol dehydrogenase [Bacteroidetes bacterium 43-16]|nr:MAG: histidinol dehydrogenase [Bacteroidetes bacterium 43-16]
MKTYNSPDRATLKRLCQRPAIKTEDLEQAVRKIMDRVKSGGDKALNALTLELDQADIKDLEVKEAEIAAALVQVVPALAYAIQVAAANIEKFHRSQIVTEARIETSPGVFCWRKSVPVEKVGIYIPGGSAPLFSTILMLGIPAQLAGCNTIILCTPPDKQGNIDPAILYTAHLLGIKNIYKAGGAQAIAAMAYGTETIPKVYKIFGPGNQYVTKAKTLLQIEGMAIDMPAGPSELLIIADQYADPDFVAADLLSQAEHGADSQVVLLSNSSQLIHKTLEALVQQLENLPRKDIAIAALANSMAIQLDSIAACFDFSNEYAPEHLILALEKPEFYTGQIINAGSVFLGKYACESAGDYASGTNHTLPTNGFAKSYSGVSLDSFYKKITFQSISEKGIQNIGPVIETMAEAEALYAHKNAVSIRLKKLQA